MDTILCTYPRTGSRFFAQILKDNTDLKFDESHNFRDCPRYRNIITLVRDPIDTFVSQILLEIECQNELNKDTGSNDINNHLKGKDGKLDYGKCVGASKNMFLDFYANTIRYYNGIALNFDDITNKDILPEKLILLSEKLDFNITTTSIEYDFELTNPGIIPDVEIFNSSKKSEKYQEVLDYVTSKKHLISDIYSIYQKIVSSYCI